MAELTVLSNFTCVLKCTLDYTNHPWYLFQVVTMLVTFVMVLLPAAVAKGAIFFIVAQTNPKLV